MVVNDALRRGWVSGGAGRPGAPQPPPAPPPPPALGQQHPNAATLPFDMVSDIMRKCPSSSSSSVAAASRRTETATLAATVGSALAPPSVAILDAEAGTWRASTQPSRQSVPRGQALAANGSALGGLSTATRQVGHADMAHDSGELAADAHLSAVEQQVSRLTEQLKQLLGQAMTAPAEDTVPGDDAAAMISLPAGGKVREAGGGLPGDISDFP